MSKKKLVIAGGSFAGLVALYFILKSFPRATELADLTPEDLEEVERYVSEKTLEIERAQREAEEEAKDLPPDYQGSWFRTKARQLVEKLKND